MIPAQNFPEFKRNAVAPIECLKGGWALIKDQYWLFVGISVVGLMIGSAVPFGILMGPMMCGVYLALLQRMAGQPIEFGTLFKGFDYFKDGLIAALLHYLPMIIIFAPFYVVLLFAQFAMMASSRDGEPNPAALSAFFLILVIGLPIMMILLIILSIGFAFAYQLIVDRNLSGVDAVKVSFRAGLANFWRLFGLFLLNGLLGMGGAILCYVGLIFVLPITFAAMAVAYKQVFGEAPVRSPYPPPPPLFPPPPPASFA